ncbi:MAG: hypothetical protein QWI73_01180 [Alphaproteobacteria bacterium]|nr:hypothetical protein [Alphaproteobacteria bacterium]
MQTTVVDIEHLAKIRRLEALSARAWPADSFFYERAWHVGCYKAEFPALGSKDVAIITPLDASDNVNIKQRVEALKVKLGQKIYLRITPLAAKEIAVQLDLGALDYILKNNVFIASAKDVNFNSLLEISPLTPEEYAEVFSISKDLVRLELESISKIKGKVCYFSTIDRSYGARYILDNGFAYIDRWPSQDGLASAFMEAVIAHAVRDKALYVWYKAPAGLIEPGFNFECLYSEAYYAV